MTVSNFIPQRVHACGIRRIYGYSGDGMLAADLNRPGVEI